MAEKYKVLLFQGFYSVCNCRFIDNRKQELDLSQKFDIHERIYREIHEQCYQVSMEENGTEPLPLCHMSDSGLDPIDGWA